MKLFHTEKTPMTMIDFINHLKSLGYKKIGQGFFAVVYSLPNSKYVVKVGTMKHKNTDSYLTFLQKINPDNPLFPKIEAIKQFECPDFRWHLFSYRHYYVVHMERLAKFGSIRTSVRNRLLTKVYNIPSYRAFEKNNIGALSKSLVPDVSNASKILKHLYRNFAPDIHSGNFMWRVNDGMQPQLVIVDPIV